MIETLIKNWWFLAARGAFAICFGILVLSLREWSHSTFFAAIAFTTIGLLFAGFAVIAGFLTMFAALPNRGQGKHSWVLALDGLAGVVLGIVIMATPEFSFVVLLRMMAVWALVVGVCEGVVATHLRRHIADEWLLGLAGFLSGTFGVLLFTVWPESPLALFYWMGAYAIFSGIAMTALSLRLRSFRQLKAAAHAPRL